MSEPSTEERALANALGSYVTGMQADPELYGYVRQWRKRRRRVNAVLAAVAVLFIAAVPIALTTLGGDGTREPAAPVYTHSNGVRGSLGGDQQLLDDAKQAVLTKKDHSTPWPDDITPVYAERDPRRDVTVVLFTGTSRTDKHAAFGITATRVGHGPWDVPNSNPQTMSMSDPKGAAAAQQRFWGSDMLWMPTVDIGNPKSEYVAIVVPPNARAEAGSATGVSPGGVLQRSFVPLPLHDGTLLLDVTGSGPTSILITRNGDLLSNWTLRQSTAGIYRVDNSLRPTPAQVAEAATHARGTVDPEALNSAVQSLDVLVQQFKGLHMRFRVIWGGRIDGQPCALVAMQFDGGALSADLECTQPGGGSGGTQFPLLPAGSFDTSAVAYSVLPGRAPYAVLAQPGATRVELEYADHNKQSITLHDGYGTTTRTGKAVTYRVYDKNGHLMQGGRVISLG